MGILSWVGLTFFLHLPGFKMHFIKILRFNEMVTYYSPQVFLQRQRIPCTLGKTIQTKNDFGQTLSLIMFWSILGIIWIH